jgi:protein-tyrosine kinase
MEKISQAIERSKAARPASIATHDLSGPPTLELQERPDLIAPSTARQYPVRQVALNAAYLETKRIIAHDITDPRSKSFDMLRTQVLQTMEIKSWQTIGVTSPTPGCGKTVVSTNLALSIARQQNRSVLLADLDFQKPQVSNYLGLNCKQGILSVLEGEADLTETIVDACVKNEKVSVLPCETAILNSSEWLASKSMDNIFQQTKRDFSDGIVIYDLPPVLTGDDVITILPRLDCILFVAAIGITTKSDLKESNKHLELSSVVRFVLNKSSELPATYYARYSETSVHGHKRRRA